MTPLLKTAFAKASALPEDEQDAFAHMMLAELDAERRWANLFARPESDDLLERLAAEALAAHRSGKTQPLDLPGGDQAAV